MSEPVVPNPAMNDAAIKEPVVNAQLLLPLERRRQCRLDRYAGVANAPMLSALAGILAARGREPAVAFTSCWLWGGPGLGKTHLALAFAAQALAAGGDVSYLDARQLCQLPVLPVQALVPGAVVLLDNVDALAANPVWEAWLFGLWNQLFDQRGVLLLTAMTAPGYGTFVLPDLRSRLAQAEVWALHEPLPAESGALLVQLAADRGFDVPLEVRDYLLARVPRDMASLSLLLEQLATETLVARRRLTLPFVRTLLETGRV